MPQTEQIQQIKNSNLAYNEIHLSVLKSLAYSEVFSYPLQQDEILKGMDVRSTESEVESAIQELRQKKIIHKWGDFYSLSEDSSNLKLRLERNNRAQKYLKWAYRISSFIGLFPFVRAVFISGSLSKYSMDEDSDIDYFIITKAGHLWTCRTILILFKKLFLFNSYKLFCLNYFLDTSNLTVKDESIYVAHEINTLIPTYGKEHCQNFLNSNIWVAKYLPNSQAIDVSNCKESRSRGFKWFFEMLLENRVGNAVEMKFMKLSEAYWNRKFSHLKKEELSTVSVSKKNMSSHHPDNFKKVVLNRQQTILNELEDKFDLTF